jgi:hypothetical protein
MGRGRKGRNANLRDFNTKSGVSATSAKNHYYINFIVYLDILNEAMQRFIRPRRRGMNEGSRERRRRAQQPEGS